MSRKPTSVKPSDEALLDGIDVRAVRRVAQLAEELGLSELEIQHGERRIRVRRGGEVAAAAAVSSPARVEAAAPTTAVASAVLPAGSVVLRAPMAGTFYRAPAPGQPVFVDAGSAVQPDTVVCIIESMKMMNRIEAERSGRIGAVLVANGARIQLGQPLFALTD